MNIEADAARAVHAAGRDFRNLFRDGHPSPAPAPSFTPAAQEAPVSLGTEIHRIAAVAEAIGDDAAAVLQVIVTHPEGVAILRDIAQAAGLPLPAGALTAAGGAFKVALAAWNAAHQAAAHADQQASGAQPVQQPQQVM